MREKKKFYFNGSCYPSYAKMIEGQKIYYNSPITYESCEKIFGDMVKSLMINRLDLIDGCSFLDNFSLKEICHQIVIYFFEKVEEIELQNRGE